MPSVHDAFGSDWSSVKVTGFSSIYTTRRCYCSVLLLSMRYPMWLSDQLQQLIVELLRLTRSTVIKNKSG